MWQVLTDTRGRGEGQQSGEARAREERAGEARARGGGSAQRSAASHWPVGAPAELAQKDYRR